jgi:3-oxoacyl-[acyl-carrier-protein] synthase-3
MNPLPIKIVGVGRHLPSRIVTNAEVEKMAGLESGYIDRSSAGVRERRWVDADASNSKMAALAAEEALDDAGMTIDDIDLILNGSGSAEQAIPDNGPLIQRHLGAAESGIASMSVHATCLSFLVALNAAANYIATGQYKNILVVSSEISSRGINPKEAESFVLFGDAAAAAVVTRTPKGETSGMSKYVFRTFGIGAYATTVMGGGMNRHPNHPDTKPEDNLFSMKGFEVFRMARKYGGPTLEMIRPGLSKGLGDIHRVVPHQASGMAMDAMSFYGWPTEKIARTIDRLGNCIAASIPSTLYETIRDGSIERGDKFLIIGTGAGLSIGGAILTY